MEHNLEKGRASKDMAAFCLVSALRRGRCMQLQQAAVSWSSYIHPQQKQFISNGVNVNPKLTDT